MSAPPTITLVGGGVATLLLGVELRARRPELPVTLLTADGPERAGGHLASWSEGGYPVEHGFHALFEFYDTALELLERHGLSSRFVRGPDHFFVYERGALHTVGHGLASALAPATGLERMYGLMALPVLQRTVAAIVRGDPEVLAAVDAEDFRGALLRMGAGRSFVESSTVRMFYDFGFVGDRELSAAVGLSVVARLLRAGRMRHFRGPSRPTLIDPLRARFVALGGRLVERAVVSGVRLEGGRARGIVVRNDGGPPVEQPVDELVLGLAVESFKRLEWVGGVPDFVRDARRLEGAESVSLQAWFDEDPVPAHVDSVIGGLPEPWSTLCPQTRVRGERRGPHGYELIACGPASGFERTPDEALVGRFFDMLRRLGFSVPSGAERGDGVHVVLRRNQAPAERYLLTRPGELWLRPTPITGVPNLSLVGAWLRTRFAMPSVEAAAQSAVTVRDALEARHPPGAALGALDATRPDQAARPAHALRAGPSRGDGLSWDLVPEPPYRHDGTTRLFSVAVDPETLAARIPAGLELAPGFDASVLWFVSDYRDAYAISDPARVRHAARELMIAAVVRERGRWSRPPGLFPVAIYIDSDVALAVGREVYGFAKRFARLSVDGDGLVVERPIALADGADVHSASRALVRARWVRGRGGLGDGAGAWLSRGVAGLVDAGGGVRLYNQTRAVQPIGLRAPLVRAALTCTPAFDVHIGASTPLEGFVAEVIPSRTDPIHTLLPPGATQFTARGGAEFALGFSIDRSEEVAQDVV